LGAVALLLGERADTSVLFDDTSKGIIEGHFAIGSYALQALFEEEDMEYEEWCIIRRELSPNGRSRAFVNDSPVRLESLKRLGEQLMDVHSQHQNLALGDQKFQIHVLDVYADALQLRADYGLAYQAWRKGQKSLEKLNALAAEAQRDREYNQFMFDELDSAKLRDGELESLEAELLILEGAEDIREKLAEVLHLMQDGEFNALALLGQVKHSLQQLSKYGHSFQALAERLESAYIELDDLSESLHDEADRVEVDPEKTQLLRDRVDTLQRLLNKHQVRSEAELISIRADYEQKLLDVANLDEDILHWEHKIALAHKQLQEIGEELSTKRKQVAPALADEISRHCRALGMPNASFTVQIQAQPPAIFGLDQVAFLFSANKGVAPADIKQVASGGEFSRLIFALKFILAGKTSLPTIIFDEIDAGISGEIARKMAEMMREMGKNHQVIAITHLPQMAAGGERHFFVYKEHDESRSYSKIRALDEEERIREIAGMIGGERAGEAVVQAAKDLLQDMRS